MHCRQISSGGNFSHPQWPVTAGFQDLFISRTLSALPPSPARLGALLALHEQPRRHKRTRPQLISAAGRPADQPACPLTSPPPHRGPGLWKPGQGRMTGGWIDVNARKGGGASLEEAVKERDLWPFRPSWALHAWLSAVTDKRTLELCIMTSYIHYTSH